MSTRAVNDERDEMIVADVPSIHTPLKQVSSSLVRDWVRSALVPDALLRLYNIGMGVTTFNVPTMAGNTVIVEAPAAVQRAALRDVISVGVPAQIGLTPDEGETPGVLALGEWELAGAREDAHTASAREQPRIAGGIEVPENGESGESGEGVAQGARGTPNPATESSSLSAPVDVPYVPPAGHEVVVVTEDGREAARDVRGEEPPPAPNPERNALAKSILAKRRAAREPRSVQPKAGTHPNHE